LFQYLLFSTSYRPVTKCELVYLFSYLKDINGCKNSLHCRSCGSGFTALGVFMSLG